MDKKEVFVVALICVLTFSIVASAVSDVAYIYKKAFKIDDNIIDVFDSAGLTIDLIQENSIPSDLSNYKLIFVGDENFRRLSKIPVNNVPSVVANYYHSGYWGLTDEEGVSKLASTHPLSVRKNNQMIPVYTSASAGQGGPSISYYYLDIENKAPPLETVALTETTSSGNDFGDVISYAHPGDLLLNGNVQQNKMCFFGIVESDYWTPQARNLFEDCVGFVASECSIDADCGSSGNSGEPFCKDGDVYQQEVEYSCQNGGLVHHCVNYENDVLVEVCENGCDAGACIQIECFENSDCGNDGYISDLFCSVSGNSVRNYGEFTCNSPGTAQSQCESEVSAVTVETCEDACVEGVCRDVACYSELDCGTDGFVGAPFCSIDGDVTQTYRDYSCLNAGTVDSVCESLLSDSLVEECSDICFNGACGEIICEENSDCNDLNPLTFDECINPGTFGSECRSTEINCVVDLDCGFTGFVGTEYCSVNDVFKNYQVATCANGGTLQSQCLSSTTSQQIDSCEFACTSGTCIRCDQNSDCTDGNPQTPDVCVNPGSVGSYCQSPEEPEIACSNDLDCGTDNILSDLFCYVNDVSQLTMEWSCNNPGLETSYCSTSLIRETVQYCPDFCDDGSCVTIDCFNHADCTDGSATTIDLCNNPGTAESYCSHNPVDILCYSDSDCGVSGVLASGICVGNEVTDLTQEFTCNSPGTILSYCSSIVSQETVEVCSFACSEGVCIDEPTECTAGETQQCGSTNVGECSFGIETCSLAGDWGACVGTVNPVVEICDGLDNDCDGSVDEGGVCVPPCTDECTLLDRMCTDIENYKVCGDFDGDGCTEWSLEAQCGYSLECSNGLCV